MAKSYPVQFKGTAIGDPAITYNPQKRTNNLNRNISNAGQAKDLSALSKSAENKVEFKGTPIGDPARSLTPDRANNSNRISSAIDPTKISVLSNANDRQISAASAYKGTALGDPAEKLAAKSYPVEYKGTAFGDPAKFADVRVEEPASELTRSNVLSKSAVGALALANQSAGSVLNLLV